MKKVNLLDDKEMIEKKPQSMEISDFIQKSKVLLKRYSVYLKKARKKGVVFVSVDFSLREYFRQSVFAKDEQELFNIYNTAEKKIKTLEDCLSATFSGDLNLDKIAGEMEHDLKIQR